MGLHFEWSTALRTITVDSVMVISIIINGEGTYRRPPPPAPGNPDSVHIQQQLLNPESYHPYKVITRRCIRHKVCPMAQRTIEVVA